ncbi:uncharacterized protein LOC112594898 [Melanaphis sacchari]|uniref:uncharacterized protein LOC112594898 n=1 Tax=Melanaphis sacchari TaxID=742174 RepID=UPI000DC15503|nr:uncharacterized protein LOC112594898 [Melanaphis sacchari]
MSESTKRSLLSYFKVEPKRLKTSGDEDDPQEIPENPQLQCNSKNNISTSSSNLVSINDTSLNDVRIECTNELSTEQIVCSYDISLYVGPKARKYLSLDSRTYNSDNSDLL